MFKYVYSNILCIFKTRQSKKYLLAAATGPAASTVSLAASLATSSATMSHLIKFVITLIKKKKFA
jgi:hypothetical protein